MPQSSADGCNDVNGGNVMTAFCTSATVQHTMQLTFHQDLLVVVTLTQVPWPPRHLQCVLQPVYVLHRC